MQNIIVETKDYPGNKQITVLSVKGYLDTTTTRVFEEQLNRALLDKKFNLIVDLKEADYISSAGWGIFIGEIKRIRNAKGDLVLAGMKPEVVEIFELLEFGSILGAFADVEKAAQKAFPNLAKASRTVKGRQAAPLPLGITPPNREAPALAEMPVAVLSGPAVVPTPRPGFGQALLSVFRGFRKKG